MAPTLLDVVAAERHLRGAQPRFGPLIDSHGPYPIERNGRGQSHFELLSRSIVFQQLAGAAATTIWNRFRALVPGRLTPEAVLALPEELIRAAGLSGAKAASVRDLAAKVATGEVPLQRIARFDDEEVVERLTVVRGIGRWTAEMFLMFRLGRPDVWPAGDLGVRKGLALVTGTVEPPTMKEMPALGEPFAPYRSVAAWYCWRAVETITPEGW
jgi:3-methyladenine DNA glycosylase/8-oxoguanine DNA glycosylase